MENLDQSEEPVAFDMGVSTLTRINYWLWKCNEFSFDNDVHNQYKTLKIVFNEMHPFMVGKKDRTNEFKESKELITAYKDYIEWEGNSLIFSRQNKTYPVNPPAEIFTLLRNWELKLRDFIDEKKMYMRKGEDASSTMMKS